jgi:F-type H+-transporting ATPase subunit epsilon
MSIILSITIPSEIAYKNTVAELVLPTITGQIGILSGHIPTIVALDIGILRLRETLTGKWIPILILNGFAQIENNVVKLVVADYEEILKEDYQNDIKELELASKQVTLAKTPKEKFKASNHLRRTSMKLEGQQFLK